MSGGQPPIRARLACSLRHRTVAAMRVPEYACALLTDPHGWMLWQLRPTSSRHAADQLTCFGGRIETGEDATVALRRELREELALEVAADLPVAVELWRGRHFIASFHAVPTLRRDAPLRCEPGFVAVWVPPAALVGLPISPWHAAALSTWRQGRRHCDLDQE